MLMLELRDPGVGVVVRSYQEEDCAQFLRRCIRRKRRDVTSLMALDHFSASVLNTEVMRLQRLLDLICDSSAEEARRL